MLGAPVPSFPAVRIPHLHGVTPEKVEERSLAAVRGMYGLGLSVTVGLSQNGGGTVFLNNPLQLAGNNIQGFIP